MKDETLPETVEEALEQMRFGCPFERFRIGEYDVPYFERRMTRAAEILQAALEQIVANSVKICQEVQHNYTGGAPDWQGGCQACAKAIKERSIT